MKLTPELLKQLEEDLSKAKTYEDLMGKDGAIKKLLKSCLEIGCLSFLNYLLFLRTG